MIKHSILICTFLGLVFACGTASAKWVKFNSGRDEKGRASDVTYVDPDSMRRTGNLVRISFLVDFRKPQTSASGQKSRSWIWDKEYDCRTRQHRYVRIAYYSGNMGQGTARFDRNADPDFARMQKWSKVDNDADDSDIPPFKYACGKR